MRLPTETGRESSIASKCIELMLLDGWRHVDTDPKWLRGMAVAEKGIADSLFIRYRAMPRLIAMIAKVANIGGLKLVENALQRAYAEVLWVEWKAIKGVTSQRQHDWHTAERARGALTWKAKEDFEPTLDGYLNHYVASGLMLNNLTVGARR